MERGLQPASGLLIPGTQTSLNDLVLDEEAGKFKSLNLRQIGAT